MRNLFQKVYTILTFVSAPGEYSTCMNMVIVSVRSRNKENAFSDTPVRNYLRYIILVEIIPPSPNILNS